MDIPVASSSSIGSGRKQSDTNNNGWFNLKSSNKKQKSDFCLRPAEKLFIHCCTIFILSFRCLAARHDAIYSDKFAKFMDIMADVCSIPSFNERKRDKLLTESHIQAQAFSYYLHISLITSEDIEKIASRGRQDRVFLVAEYFDAKGKLHSNTMQLYQFTADGKWLPSYDYITKKTDSLMLHLSHAVVDSDQAIKLKLIVVKTMCEICPLKVCEDKQTMLIVKLNPSQIHWNGVIKSFSVLEKPSGLPNLRLKIKLKWALKPRLSRGGYNLFRKCWKLHGQLLVRFFHYRWRKRSNLHSLHAKCLQTTEKAAIVPLIFEETLTNLCFDDLIRPSVLDFTSPLSSEFCVCSEWCSIYAFYHANPIVRFVLGQNQHFFLVPDDLVIPYHFKSICSFINVQNYYCSSMFSSILHAVYFYIKTSLEERAGNNEEAFWRSRGARILEEGYWLLRDWFVRPESFEPSKYPFDEYPDCVRYFADSLTWLATNLKNVSDMKLNAILQATVPQISSKNEHT